MRMIRMIHICAIFMTGALLLTACGSISGPDATISGESIAAVTPLVPADIDRSDWPVIVAFGDSLTYGQGVDRDRTYPSQLQALLDQEGYRYRVVNEGVTGDTTEAGLARLENVIAHQPELVILEFGANDGLRGLPLDAMKQNLATMIERLQEAEITVVLAGMQVPPNYGERYTRRFEQVYRDLAAEYDIPLIPYFLEGVGGRPELNLPDGIHPTASGYSYVVGNVFPVLEPLLRD